MPSSGVGSIVSWRAIDRAPTDRWGGLVPLTIAIVELDEGPWVYTSIEGRVPSLPHRPVRVQFQPRPWHDRFPVFAISADQWNTAGAAAGGSGHIAQGEGGDGRRV
ncbi:OB-fold domain-containing protein [Nocardia beijingensis]